MSRIFLIAMFLLISFPSNASDDSAIESAKEFFQKQMKDPDSLQFRNIIVIKKATKSDPESISVCGELNAKNSYGGYVGFKPFYFQSGWGEFLNDKSEGSFKMMFDVVCSN